MYETQVFTLRSGNELLAAAQVAPPILDRDPEPPDLGLPARLRMVAAAVPRHRYGLGLVEGIRSQVYADLVHDGCLSIAGEVLVARAGLAMEPGKALDRISNERVAELTDDLIHFVIQNPAGKVVV